MVCPRTRAPNPGEARGRAAVPWAPLPPLNEAAARFERVLGLPIDRAPDWRRGLGVRPEQMGLRPRQSRRRSNVRVRGCGCCLPLSLAMASMPMLALRLLSRAAR